MPVCHCGRETKGFYYQKPLAGKRDVTERPITWCCSMECLDAAYGNTAMIDPTEHEIAAIEACSEPAGQYIESLGRTDMASWSRDEWLSFLECVITGYIDELKRVSVCVKKPS